MHSVVRSVLSWVTAPHIHFSPEHLQSEITSDSGKDSRIC